MVIFESYTGNAMLNNALMSIEALGDLGGVSEITPDVLLRLYEDKGLLKLNKRLKSYTMLFTKNGPLHNDKVNGDKIYDALIRTIISSFENEGECICEISGLHFHNTFSKVYESALRTAGFTEKDIQKKDTNIGRTWFPLIGGLGSDAQALPQAKFTVQIHPICVAILQFLPLSSLLYKGGILLIDSSNFALAKQYVADNQKEMVKRIQGTKSTEPVENVRDFSKGNYILKAVEILEEKEEFEEVYSDLNLWSFSNSGTGASCEIDRVPNSMIKKLVNLRRSSPTVGSELKYILNNDSSYFLNALEANEEWGGLYPNVFGSGKKKVNYKGVSIAFLEAYFKETGNVRQTEYAKYLAYLIDKYKTKSFERYLDNTDAWDNKRYSYRIDLYAVLVEATKRGEWDLHHHIQIIDDADFLPIKNTFFNLHKLTHFYYQNKAYSDKCPQPDNEATNTDNVCKLLIALIQRDERCKTIIEKLTNRQEYTSVSYVDIFLRSSEWSFVNLDVITSILYNSDFYQTKNGLDELLRIFFNQKEQGFYEVPPLYLSMDLRVRDQPVQKWFDDFEAFSKDYQDYFYSKYENEETGAKPYRKFKNLIKGISMETPKFLYWFREAIERVNEYLRLNGRITEDRWSDSILYNPQGDFTISFVKLAIKLSLLKRIEEVSNKNQILIS